MTAGPAAVIGASHPEEQLAVREGSVEAEVERALGELRGGRAKAAAETLRGALAREPLNAAAVRSLAVLLHLEGRDVEALALADGVLAAAPDHGEAWLARGDALSALGQVERAPDCYRHALAHPETAFDARMKLGTALLALGHEGAARQALDEALALRPDDPGARFQRGLLRLQLRDFAAGWADYEARWQVPGFVARSRGVVSPTLAPSLETGLTAADLAGHRVLLVGEQGIGDEVMFASMVPDLADIAAGVTYVCDPRLVRLFSASFKDVQVLAPAEARVEVGAVDKVLAVGSLGAAFRPDAAAFPGTSYLRPGAAVRARWAERLGPSSGRRRIGLSWRGGTPTSQGRARSLTLDQLAPILELPDCDFVSLQYGDVRAELEAFNAGRDKPVARIAPAEIRDFDDLAGLVANLDAVVSVQTALVHLCGAIGAPCLTLLPRHPTWRYMARGETLPWYRSVRLFRQTGPDAWDPVVAEVARALRE